MISDFVISEEKILNIIRALNPNKAHGWDEISVRMIKFSDVALVNPLKIYELFETWSISKNLEICKCGASS